MCHCIEEPLSQFRRSVPAIASAGKKHKRPKTRFFLGLQECEGSPERVGNECHPACIDLSKSTQKSEPRGGGTQLSVLQLSKLQSIPGILPVCCELTVH
jgi:hypothetical protein